MGLLALIPSRAKLYAILAVVGVVLLAFIKGRIEKAAIADAMEKVRRADHDRADGIRAAADAHAREMDQRLRDADGTDDWLRDHPANRTKRD
jgi:hypothetical protein